VGSVETFQHLFPASESSTLEAGGVAAFNVEGLRGCRQHEIRIKRQPPLSANPWIIVNCSTNESIDNDEFSEDAVGLDFG